MCDTLGNTIWDRFSHTLCLFEMDGKAPREISSYTLNSSYGVFYTASIGAAHLKRRLANQQLAGDVFHKGAHPSFCQDKQSHSLRRYRSLPVLSIQHYAEFGIAAHPVLDSVDS